DSSRAPPRWSDSSRRASSGSVTVTHRGRNRAACSNRACQRVCALRPRTCKRSERCSITSRQLRPMDPVEPSTTTRRGHVDLAEEEKSDRWPREGGAKSLQLVQERKYFSRPPSKAAS